MGCRSVGSGRRSQKVRPSGTQNIWTGTAARQSQHQWVTNITNIRTAEHWLYLCIVLNLLSGWSMSPRQDRQLLVQAVLMVLWQRPPSNHSALGSLLSLYLRIPTIPEATSGHLQHECGEQLR
ncbi:MAG: insF [Nitrospira sp.]|jgi:hypothetical protein|nr:insF [Nitrospira sp.]